MLAAASARSCKPSNGCSWARATSCPNVCGPSYFSLSLSAAWTGGMPLMRGMTILAGLVEVVMAPIVQKLKHVFPNYIVGLVVALVGVSVITPSVTSLFGPGLPGRCAGNCRRAGWFCHAGGDGALQCMGQGPVKIYSLLIGMLTGWLAALCVSPESRLAPHALRGTAWVALPGMPWEAWDSVFRPATGAAVHRHRHQRLAEVFRQPACRPTHFEPELKRPNFKPLRNGSMADGLSTMLAGALGGMAVDTSSSNVAWRHPPGVAAGWEWPPASSSSCWPFRRA